MTVLVCISDSGGMLFNKRRVSRDAKVISDIAELAAGREVFVSMYSAPLFADSEVKIKPRKDPLKDAGEGDLVFVEDMRISPYKDRLDGMVIYNWNRSYPSDFSLDVTPEKLGMTLESTLDFVGRSHEKVTRLIWKGEKNK